MGFTCLKLEFTKKQPFTAPNSFNFQSGLCTEIISPSLMETHQMETKSVQIKKRVPARVVGHIEPPISKILIKHLFYFTYFIKKQRQLIYSFLISK